MVIQKSRGGQLFAGLNNGLIAAGFRVCEIIMEAIIDDERIACQWKSTAVLRLVSCGQTRVFGLLAAILLKDGL